MNLQFECLFQVTVLVLQMTTQMSDKARDDGRLVGADCTKFSLYMCTLTLLEPFSQNALALQRENRSDDGV